MAAEDDGEHNMIKIMVDAASDCRKEDGLYDLFIPLTVDIEGECYRAGIDLTGDAFYERLVQMTGFPKTAQPSPEEFSEIFEKARDNGDEIIYLALSSALSGTYQCACMVREMVGYEGIHIVDTKTATHMIAMLAQYAKKLVAQGLSAQEIVQKCETAKSKVKVLAGLDTLEYLYRGGRLNRATATVGELAGIKPVITVTEDGEVEAIGKGLGVVRSMQFIMNKLASYEIDPEFPMYSLYSMGEANCVKLEGKLKDAGYNIEKRVQLGSTIGCHIGPGVFAVVFAVK